MSTSPRFRAPATDSQPWAVRRGIVAGLPDQFERGGVERFRRIVRVRLADIPNRRLDERGCARVIVSGPEVCIPDGVQSAVDRAQFFSTATFPSDTRPPFRYWRASAPHRARRTKHENPANRCHQFELCWCCRLRLRHGRPVEAPQLSIRGSSPATRAVAPDAGDDL